MIFLTPTDVSPGTTGGWVDVDLSGYVPAGTSGVALRFINSSASDVRIGVRNNDSTDSNDYFLENSSQQQMYVGVDGSRICEVWRGNTSITIYIDGYYGSESVFRTDATNVAAGATSAWVSVDITSYVSAGVNATAALFVTEATDASGWGYRPPSSTDDRHLGQYGLGGYIVGLSANSCEIWRGNASHKLHLMGYLKSGYTVVDPATTYSGSATGTYWDFTALPSGALGAVMEAYNSTSDSTKVGMRKNGETYDHYWDMRKRQTQRSVECDSSRIVENKRSNTSTVYYLNGYYVSETQVPVSGSFRIDGGSPTITRYLKFPHVYANLILLTTGGSISWVSYNISNLVPSDATGVALRFVNGGSAASIGARGSGTADNEVHTLAANGTTHLFAKIINGRIEYYRSVATCNIYLEAVFGPEAVFFDEARYLAVSQVDAWETVSIASLLQSAELPIAAFVVNTLGTADTKGFRKTGSTDNHIGTHDGPHGYIVGCDSSSRFDAYRGTSAQQLWCKGYLTGGGTFPTNATEYSGSATGSYWDFTAFPSGAVGALITTYNVGGGSNQFALRANGATYDYYSTLATEQNQLLVAVDSSRLMENKRSSTNTRFYSTGYLTNEYHQPTIGEIAINGGAADKTHSHMDEPYEGLFFFEGQQIPIDKMPDGGLLYFNGSYDDSIEGGTLYLNGGAVSVRRHGWSAIASPASQYQVY